MKARVDLIMVCAGSQGPGDKQHLPLALLYVGTALRSAGYDVKIWHLLPDEFASAVDDIQRANPLWIGLSVLSGMTTLYAADLSKQLKVALPETPIVWGGHHPSSVPDETLRAAYLDMVVIGEGELTAVALSNALLMKQDLSEVAGIGWKTKDGRPVLNMSRDFVADVDSLDIDWDLIDPAAYFKRDQHGAVNATFYSSRGCPYKCTFCTTPSYTGKLYRAHSPDFVERHVQYLKDRFGVNTIFFGDDNFMINRQRGMEILHRLAKIGINIGTLDVRLNQLNESVLKEFVDNRVTGLFFGFESGNDRILDLLRKGLSVGVIREKAELISRHGIPVWASSILGVPTETREEIYDTIDLSMWLRDVLPDGSTVSNFRYMPLPRTELLKLAIQNGFPYPKSPEEWSRIDPVGPYYASTWLGWLEPEDEEFFKLVQELGRLQLLNMRRDTPTVPSKLRNLMVARLRDRVKERTLRNDMELKSFLFTARTYEATINGRLAGGRSPGTG